MTLLGAGCSAHEGQNAAYGLRRSWPIVASSRQPVVAADADLLARRPWQPLSPSSPSQRRVSSPSSLLTPRRLHGGVTFSLLFSVCTCPNWNQIKIDNNNLTQQTHQKQISVSRICFRQLISSDSLRENLICKVDKTFIQYHAATWTVLKRVTEKSEAEQSIKIHGIETYLCRPKCLATSSTGNSSMPSWESQFPAAKLRISWQKIHFGDQKTRTNITYNSHRKKSNETLRSDMLDSCLVKKERFRARL